MNFLTAQCLAACLNDAGLADASCVVENVPLQQKGETLSPDPTGPNLHLADTENIYPASMIKVPLAVAFADAMHDQTLPDEPLCIESAHVTHDDAPSPLQIGYFARPWELIDIMISASNNTATNVLLDRIGRREATRRLRQLGLGYTSIERYVSGSAPRLNDPLAQGENTHPAIDAALVFKMLVLGQVPFADKILDALKRQIWNTKLSVTLAPGDIFAHKTGETSEYCHDGGILYTNSGKVYIIVVYSKLPATEETDQRFARFMKFLRPEL